MEYTFATHAEPCTIGVQARRIDGTLYIALACAYGECRYGRAFAVKHPRRIAVIVALACVLCASGAVSAAGTHTVRSHTVASHTVAAHTVASHTATNAYGTTYTVKAHAVRSHIVRAYTVATHVARNPVRRKKGA